MAKVARTNEYEKPVYEVDNIHIVKVPNSYDKYELQLNGEYYELSEKQIEAIESVTRLPEGVGISMG